MRATDIAAIVTGGVEIVTPEALCRDRGFDLSRISVACIFVDVLTGYAIVDKSSVARIRDKSGTKAFFSPNLRMSLAKASDERPMEAERGWYLDELGGWPAGTGRGQRIAILDGGILYGSDLLPREADHSDFCSSSCVGADTGSIGTHGTRCAGAVGAHVKPGEPRRSVAPDSKIIAAQVVLRGYSEGTTLADFLLMISWAIHRWKVRVLSYSYSARIRQSGDDMLSMVAERLRALDLALIFCSVGEDPDLISYPANARGVVAVAGYEDPVPGSEICFCNIKHPEMWSALPDLFLAPVVGIMAVNSSGKPIDDFEGTSAACAFAAGMALLYMESYPCATVNQVLTEMKEQAKLIGNPDFPQYAWSAVRFPEKHPPSCFVKSICRAIAASRSFLLRSWLLWRERRAMRHCVRLVSAPARSPSDTTSPASPSAPRK
ncbi:S8/S53 family peptidase [Tahibacter sp.]|uniref:S8/S53 family peptidase n=1 Tax=Tahibacter sp. TaxID=2056211 RepID=UPI0028C3FCFD|nr:S8/S53 family peptidase [Tahibacter sp.]